MQTKLRIRSRTLATALAVGALAAVGAGCGDDENNSAEEATEEAADQIESALDKGGQSAEDAEKEALEIVESAQDQADELEQDAKDAAEDIPGNLARRDDDLAGVPARVLQGHPPGHAFEAWLGGGRPFDEGDRIRGQVILEQGGSSWSRSASLQRSRRETGTRPR